MNDLIYNRALRALLFPFNLWPQARPTKVAIKRLLISQIAHLGDVALATSLIAPIKRHFPDLKLGCLVASASRGLLTNHPDIDALHTFDHPLLVRGMRALTSPFKELKEYDAAIDASPYFPNTIPLLTYARIPMRVGFTSGGFGKWLTHPIHWREDGRHLIEKLRDLLTPFHIACDDPNYHLPIAEQRRGTYWVMQPSGGARHKEWPLARWRAVIDYLSPQSVKIIGKGRQEREFASQLVQEADNLCDLLTLDQLKELIAGARGFIGVDSLGGHLAATYRTPSITLFHPRDDSRLWRPYASTARLLKLSSTSEEVFVEIANLSRF